MKRIGKHIGLMVLAWVFAVSASAQDPVFTASVDKNPVSEGDVFSLELTLENARGEITPPDLSDFTVVFGPSRSSSLRIINGRQSSTMSLTYTMRPKSVGTFEIGIAKVTVDGKVLTTSPIKLEVVKGASRPSAQSPTGAARDRVKPRGDQNIMVRIELSKSRVYKGEGIVATYVLLSRYNNIDLGDMEFPTLNGFWSENVRSDQTNWERNLEVVNGLSYRKAIIRRQVLFPQRTGTIEIEPFMLSGMVNRSFFNPGTEVKVYSNSPTIEVLPLPDPEPESFDGAVGTFEVGVEIDRTEVEANEALRLKINVTGRGNLKLIPAPKIDFPKDFETYDPEITDRISIGAGGVRGARTFEYLLIPRYAGNYEIPEVQFSFFDPERGRFVTESRGPFEIEVSGAQSTLPGSGAPIAQSRVESRASDIRYIVTDSGLLSPRGKLFFKSPAYLALLAFPPVLLLVFVIVQRRRAELMGDVVGRRKRRAKREAKARLKAAENALKSGESMDFYAEVFRAVFGYLSDKLNIPLSKLNKAGIADQLKIRAVGEAQIEEVLYIITTAEKARFSPTPQSADEMFYRRTVALIEKLEEVIG